MPNSAITSRISVTNSLRWRIIFWITIVVVVALASVILVTRSVLQNQVTDSANAAVEQEIEEFRQFAVEGTDPATAAPFDSPQRVLEVYLSHQIPDDDEVLLGFVDGQLIQMDLSQLSGDFQEPLASDSELADEVLRSTVPAGVFQDDTAGAVHWGRIEFHAPDTPGDSYFVVAHSTADAREVVNGEVRILTMIGMGGVLAAFLIAWLIAGQVIAPLRNLRRVASSITNSDLTQRVPVAGNDELAQLATTFNSMLDRIEIAYRDQQQFVDDAGHELRTPITVVRGQLELLDSSSPEEQERSIALATAELDRMARLVNDLLTLAVADSADFVNPKPVDVAELTLDIEDKANTMTPRAQVVAVAEGDVEVDEQRVTEAVLELFYNAVKHTDEESMIDIGSEFLGQGPERKLRIWVRDRGPGVSGHLQESLFGRFHRGEAEDASRLAGAGLGLSIVKAIATAHGGDAYVDSTVGLGSIFGLELPAGTTSPDIATPVDSAVTA